jgi:S-adenosylmethionine-dependent methyltransferase
VQEEDLVTDGFRARSAVRTAVVWDVLREVLTAQASATGRNTLEVIDAGGGTGGFAVPLAELGHHLTVVDASPDALAALQRRAAEANVRVRALQGDADELTGLVGADSADLVLCHSVLEYVDDPAVALTGIAQVVRSGGAISVLAAGRLAAVLHRALAGRFDDARHVLAAADGTWGERDPMPRRFTLDEVTALLERAGLRIGAVHGIRVVADLVAGANADGDHRATEALIALESAAASQPALRDIATQLHVLAYR